MKAVIHNYTHTRARTHTHHTHTHTHTNTHTHTRSITTQHKVKELYPHQRINVAEARQNLL
jgi:hypothetical protein